MGYSNFKNLKQVITKFNLDDRKTLLFEKIIPIQPNDWLIKSLEIADTLPLSNEKAKSESIIAPILSEIYDTHRNQIALYSGEELNVRPEDDLAGPCDFFFSKSPQSYLLKAPIVAFAEAKDEDMDWGLAQCAAQMYAAQLFNTGAGKSIDKIYGCSTTGGEWKFLKLSQETIFVDMKSYYLDQLPLILGIFHQIINEYNAS